MSAAWVLTLAVTLSLAGRLDRDPGLAPFVPVPPAVTWEQLVEADLEADLAPFPPRHVAHARDALAYAHWLYAEAAAGPPGVSCADAELCWRSWHDLNCARDRTIDVRSRVCYLAGLRGLIGDDDFHAGRMPPPIPPGHVWSED
jgi:hypothetical protein